MDRFKVEEPMSQEKVNLNRRSLFASSAGGAVTAVLAGKLAGSENREGKPSGMKITDLKTYMFNVVTGPVRLDSNTGQPISSGFKTWLFLKLETLSKQTHVPERHLDEIASAHPHILDRGAPPPACRTCGCDDGFRSFSWNPNFRQVASDMQL